MKTIGILTSGGDSQGMNAAIRAVTRTALNSGFKVMGIRKGYLGLITGDIVELTATSVSDIINRGGTMLRSARCVEFKDKPGFPSHFVCLQKAVQVTNLNMACLRATS